MRKKIIDLIKDNRPDIDDVEHTEFVSSGLFNSFDIVTLVSDLDKVFNISIDGIDIIPENFNTLDAICKLVEKNRR